MKKLIPIILALILCLGLSSCGSMTINGDPKPYSNSAKSFAIQLPTAEEGAWTINEDSQKNVLSVSDSKDLINIQVECLSKSQAQPVAENLTEFRDYIMANTLSDIAADMKLKDASAKVPDFITDSLAQSFTLKNGSTDIKGDLIFMESEKCYYLYMIMAVEKAYNGNRNALAESVLTLSENQ